jgi:hypothetical protein
MSMVFMLLISMKPSSSSVSDSFSEFFYNDIQDKAEKSDITSTETHETISSDLILMATKLIPDNIELASLQYLLRTGKNRNQKESERISHISDHLELVLHQTISRKTGLKSKVESRRHLHLISKSETIKLHIEKIEIKALAPYLIEQYEYDTFMTLVYDFDRLVRVRNPDIFGFLELHRNNLEFLEGKAKDFLLHYDEVKSILFLSENPAANKTNECFCICTAIVNYAEDIKSLNDFVLIGV